jgi:hypothetical protein
MAYCCCPVVTMLHYTYFYLMINSQQVHIQIYIYYSVISVVSYMFRQPIVVIFREISLKEFYIER